MITEDYVSFETAKLLKEKGFSGECSRFYMPNGHSRWEYQHYHDFDIRDRIECPTPQMAMKWLRKVHKVDIDIRCYWGLTPKYHIKNYMFELHYVNAPNHSINKRFSSPEEACEAAIKYCLENLI